MAENFDNIIDFNIEHINTWLITFSNVNKQNVKSVFDVQEETRELEKEILTKNLKWKSQFPLTRITLKERSSCFFIESWTRNTSYKFLFSSYKYCSRKHNTNYTTTIPLYNFLSKIAIIFSNSVFEDHVLNMLSYKFELWPHSMNFYSDILFSINFQKQIVTFLIHLVIFCCFK